MRNVVIFSLTIVLVLCLTCADSFAAKKEEKTVSFPDNKANLRYTITVSKFENKAGWHGRWDIGDGFAEIMTNALYESGWFIVLGDKEMRQEAMDEQDLNASGRTAGGKKSAKMGRMTPAQLLVRGAVTHVQDQTKGGSGGLTLKGIGVGGKKDTAEINMTMYLVDASTGMVKASTKVVGKAGKKGMRSGYSGSKLGGLRGGGEVHKDDNVGKACEDAVIQGVLYLIEQLEDIPWEGTIMLAKDDKIILNRGTREGVESGAKFDVGETEELVDPDTGEVLDVSMTKVATLEVTSVKEKISYCKALSGGSKVKKGMSVLPSS